MTEAFICDAIRTPIGRYGGALSAVRTDDLAALPISQLMARNQSVDWDKVDDVIYGCVNQAGEDNRNVARMALLLAGLPKEISGVTVNRLCASGLHAVGAAAQAIKSGDAALVVAGGVESMSRSPFVMPKADTAFSRKSEIYDTTIGWRFINPKMDAEYGTDALGVTAENLAEKYQISREDQDAFAMDSQNKAAAAQSDGRMAEEIMPVTIPQRRGDDVVVAVDEHPRGDTSMETLGKLRAAFRDGGSVTAGNSSGVNDGAAALVIASEEAVKEHGLVPRARILGMASAGVEPRLMGIGPVPSANKLLARLGLTMDDMDIIELNEAFASQSIAVLRDFGLADDDPRVNPQGGAIALGHPLGASGARLVTTATYQLMRNGGTRALCTMCVGVGQGGSVVIERV
ncbi:MAG: 3-oxoadipyl-CoA thiolase [Rhodospirillaceae bacterium]|jgi:3-oxoadipyl-CoA thiolase|nr:3-oxoadipyl-CoA thiolase [Rhodospirillaceae bacterium]MBT3886014.1 3-oxoadipyl-CoA thiolase [Rhodospirillaceae bacterium]MBT4116541.1 3-oxoadipyl-CoA thiolase [Rhodospirillaceae bacterium]MBT4671573.1 3-oxoadipyl-CoA thiolase [Rhodospirillaceae bacterium]MBT4720880.1 3-oxoadipyl-CoA thiolase [Rhodospirillaceae bacterium]